MISLLYLSIYLSLSLSVNTIAHLHTYHLHPLTQRGPSTNLPAESTGGSAGQHRRGSTPHRGLSGGSHGECVPYISAALARGGVHTVPKELTRHVYACFALTSGFSVTLSPETVL
jgi:hypothetical protein